MATRSRASGFLCSAIALLLGGLIGRAAPAVIKTDAGSVSGLQSSDGVTAYLGIPYAAPPVGPLRWRPPQPVAPWTGVRPADRFGTSCMQNEAGSRLPWTEEFMTQGPIGEDCLFLNVWKPSGGRRHAVMFWIYGGGFNEGSSTVAVYDGDALARQDVVVVSVNYRVGPLGFLVHPELTKESDHHSSGNYGLLDQIAALQWVQRNIAAFGGDPTRVTIFGQSAGAISVDDLLRSPLARGLFARAIVESGPGLLPAGTPGGTSTLADREAAGVRYAESRGAHSLADLRAMPAAAFFAAAGRGAPPAPGGTFKDGWVVTDAPPAKVPIIVGMVANDIGIGGGTAPATAAAYRDEAARRYGDRAAAFLALYPAAADADVAAARLAAARDQARLSIDRWAADRAQGGTKVYTYYFDRAIPWPAHPEFGAFHTAEVPYVFNTIHKIERPWEAVDDTLAKTVSTYWANFAKAGDPNGGSLPRWPANDPASHQTMELGARVGPMPVADAPRLAFLLGASAK